MKTMTIYYWHSVPTLPGMGNYELKETRRYKRKRAHRIIEDMMELGYTVITRRDENDLFIGGFKI